RGKRRNCHGSVIDGGSRNIHEFYFGILEKVGMDSISRAVIFRPGQFLPLLAPNTHRHNLKLVLHGLEFDGVLLYNRPAIANDPHLYRTCKVHHFPPPAIFALLRLETLTHLSIVHYTSSTGPTSGCIMAPSLA